MVPLLRSTALGLVALAIAATGATLPASSATPSSSPAGPSHSAGGGQNDHSAGEPRTALAEDDHSGDVIRERVGHDGTRMVEEQWHDPGLPPVDDATTQQAQTATAAALDAATAQAGVDTFSLHSRPGSAHTIYLDFDGGTLLSTNSWLLNGLASVLFPGWSLDGSAAFSTSERAVIEEVWARVSEDYAPFDIDVTTEEPPAGALWRSGSGDTTFGTRVAFSSGSTVQSGVCGSPCGGIAWVDVFDAPSNGETRSPAWVFPSSLGNRAKTMAEAAAHEAGHTLGLSHDGTTSSGYYAGSALWGPIMGSPYSSAVTQWSQGNYPGYNNTEDDIAIIAAGGAPLRPDEAGASVQTALPITMLPGQQGVISSRWDADWYSVDQCSGVVTVRADVAAVGPDLDVLLEVFDAAGNRIAAAAPVTTRTSSGSATGMGASVDVALSGGPYYIGVSGTGSGTSWASGGYDNYGSVGTYRVYAGGCAGAPPPPTPVDGGGSSVNRPARPSKPRVVSGVRGGKRTIGVRWTRPAAGGGTISGYQVIAYKYDSRGRVVAKATTGVQPPNVRRISLRLPSGRWAVKVRAANQAGWSSTSPRSGVVRSR